MLKRSQGVEIVGGKVEVFMLEFNDDYKGSLGR